MRRLTIVIIVVLMVFAASVVYLQFASPNLSEVSSFWLSIAAAVVSFVASFLYPFVDWVLSKVAEKKDRNKKDAGKDNDSWINNFKKGEEAFEQEDSSN